MVSMPAERGRAPITPDPEVQLAEGDRGMADIHEHEISTTGSPYAQPPATPTAQDRAATVADQATTEAANVKDTAVQAAAEVKDQAKDELAGIAQQAKSEARTLTTEARDRLQSQADGTTKQVASTVADIGHELRTLADRSDRPDGPATEVIRQLADRTERFAERLETIGYRGIADDLTRYGRNHPGTFLLCAGAAGFLVGRMLRNTDTQALAQSLKGEPSANGDRLDTDIGRTPMAVGAGRNEYGTTAFGRPDTATGGYGAGYAGGGIDLDRPAYGTPAPLDTEAAVEAESAFETETYVPPVGGPGAGRV